MWACVIRGLPSLGRWGTELPGARFALIKISAPEASARGVPQAWRGVSGAGGFLFQAQLHVQEHLLQCQSLA